MRAGFFCARVVMNINLISANRDRLAASTYESSERC